MNNFSYTTAEDVINAAIILMERSFETRDAFQSPETVKTYLRLRLANSECEIFTVMFLNNQHQLIKTEDMFRGTINQASIYPREVVKASLKYNAAAVILGHNHPSGDSVPSSSDKAITARLQSALSLVDIRLIDHIVVGDFTVTSFSENGLL